MSARPGRSAPWVCCRRRGPVDVSRVLYQLHLLPDRRQQALGIVRCPCRRPRLRLPQVQSVDTTLTAGVDLAHEGESLVATGAGEVGVAAAATSPLGTPGAWAVPPAVLSELQSACASRSSSWSRTSSRNSGASC